ncbi:MAG: hypothetical protein IT288_16800 [Bdellovibrionales bacterium]|nr:hypothetical protein [Bdellovibrionales bacterium]
MARSSSSDFLMKFASELKTRRALPKNIELAQIGPVFLASLFNEIKSNIITESVFTGMDVDPDLAVLKGLVEMAERAAYANGKDDGLFSCKTERSDGFAAFPYGVLNETKKAARQNAYFEAVERFAWATWWDDKNIGHRFEEVFFDESTKPPRTILMQLPEILSVKSIYRITPEIENGKDALVAIYFAFLEPYGVISGGAAGPSQDIESVNFRAICELLRHALAIRKVQTSSSSPATFYEKRLAHFGLTQTGTDAARTRLNRQGRDAIILPKLAIDQQVPHALDELVTVHRCYFENQPPFIGGDLERLCL